MSERIVLVGYGPVGARFVDEMLPVVRAGLVELTVVGAEVAEAYNRVLIAEYAVGQADRDSLRITDGEFAREAGVRILTGTTVTAVDRRGRSVGLATGEQLPYDRLVLATGARANVPTLDGFRRPRLERMMPAREAANLDSADAPLPRGITTLRDLDDAHTVSEAVQAARRIIVLGAGVLGMELALAAARAGSETCVVFHGEIPMARNLDRGAGMLLTRSARRAGVAMVNHSRAESVLLKSDDEGVDRFDALVCADGKQIHGDLLLLSCGIGARTELARLAGLPVSTGILVDEGLRSWGDPDIYAIGDCAHVAQRQESGDPTALPSGGPSGLIGPGWRQADWLAAHFTAELRGVSVGGVIEQRSAIVMLKAEGVDVVAAGQTALEPWDSGTGQRDDHVDGCASASSSVSQWADPEHGRYVKMVTRGGILYGFVCVGMPRTAAELTLLFERGSELPADRSVLLRYDGPDYMPSLEGGVFAAEATVCWCNGVTVGTIRDSAVAGSSTVECIGAATRAGTGCGGCKGRIGEVLERFAQAV